jgi:tRNA-dihydrouridine synthase
LVNGDVKSAMDARRAIEQTGCEGVMIGRRAIEHPWIFREVRAMLDRGESIEGPTREERFSIARLHLQWARDYGGEKYALMTARRHVGGYLAGLMGAAKMRKAIHEAITLADVHAVIDRIEERVRSVDARAEPARSSAQR